VVRHSAETAGTLILIGLVFQGITVLVLLGVGLYLLIVPFLGGIVLFLAFLALIWLILVYVFSYARSRDGDYEGARTPTLVFGILSLISGGIVSGILYIIAYVKLGDAIDEEETRKASPPSSPVPSTYSPSTRSSYPPATTVPLPPATFPSTSSPSSSGSNFCSNCGRPTAPQARFCRNCGAPLQ
jgi:hypothetical protein